MKVKIKSYYGELPSYFREGVEYDLTKPVDDLYGGWVYGDDGEDHYILINGCDYLNGGSWEIVE